jgi:hypothetical protein
MWLDLCFIWQIRDGIMGLFAKVTAQARNTINTSTAVRHQSHPSHMDLASQVDMMSEPDMTVGTAAAQDEKSVIACRKRETFGELGEFDILEAVRALSSMFL